MKKQICKLLTKWLKTDMIRAINTAIPCLRGCYSGVIEGKNMNNEHLLQASTRTSFGKGSSRKQRKNSQLPAVVYAKGKKTLSITIDPKTITKILLSPHRRNSLINLSIKDGDKTSTKHVMAVQLQKHPVKRELIHVDFKEISLKKKINVNVPLITVGRSKSVIAGGKLEQVRRFVGLSCLPANIPQKVDVDITNLPFGSTYTKDITLPEKTSLTDNPNYAIITIKEPKELATEQENTEEKSEATDAAAAKAK